jgi:hypothetical protein
VAVTFERALKEFQLLKLEKNFEAHLIIYALIKDHT